MPMPPPFDRVRRGFVATTLAACLLVACGGDGGVDSGGTGVAPQSFASGPITGFGSIVVAGVHFDESTAQVQDADGNARVASDLRLGMTVEVRGGAIAPDADGNAAATATSVVMDSAVRGPVEASDLAAQTLTVLGQNVDVTIGTVFDPALVGGLAALATGDVVEVWGTFVAATGRIVATRIEPRSAVASYALRGAIAGLDPIAQTFTIGATRVAYAGIVPPPALANGSVVRIAVSTLPLAGPAWNALLIGNGAPSPDDRPQAQVEGVVSAFSSTTQFAVNGTPVDASGAQFPDGAAGLALGVAVQVQGATRGGVLVATQVQLEGGNVPGGGKYDVRGAITALDGARQTFVVRGVTVSYAGNVDFHKGTAADLAVGRVVEARGRLSADGTLLLAARIDFRN
jgi:hypothetical protein